MADKKKYLDLQGAAAFKDKILEEVADGVEVVESYDNRVLATNYFNEIDDFSTLETVEAIAYEYEDTTNYNLVNVTFPEIELNEDLMYMVYFRVIIDSGARQRQLYRKIKLTDLTVQNDGMHLIIDATSVGLGDYIAENPDEINTLKTTYFYATLTSCNILENYLNEDTLIINGVKNTITGKDFVIVNGEENEILDDGKERVNSLYVSGKWNEINNNDYGMVIGRRNEENKNGFGMTIGTFNVKNYNDYCNILGTRNYQWFGTYIPKNQWSGYTFDTSQTPVIITIKFNISSSYTWLQGELPSVGSTIGVHTFYGIRPATITEITYDESTYLATVTFKSVESSENDTVLQWGNYTNIHGILFDNIGYHKNNTLIHGEFNSSHSYGSALFGFGNGASGNYNFVAGRHNQTLGEHSSSFGWGNIISTDNGFAIGSFNEDVANALFIVGNGATKFSRSNALSLLNNGQLTIAGDLKYNNQTSLSDKITSIEEQLPVHSSSKPITNGTVGDIVYNQTPTQDSYIGWVYTPSGWLGFGKIEASENENIPENAMVLSDGSAFTLSDGTVFLYADS